MEKTDFMMAMALEAEESSILVEAAITEAVATFVVWY